MFNLFLIIALGGIAVVLLLAARALPTGYEAKTGLKLIGGFFVIPFLVSLILSSSYIVEAKHTGVVTSFGKPVGASDPGLSAKWPWQKVTTIDGTTQNVSYHGDKALFCVSSLVCSHGEREPCPR